MESLYSIAEFEDDLQIIPSSQIIKNKSAAHWLPFMSHTRFMKAVKKKISPEDNWSIYTVKQILATASKLHTLKNVI